MNEWTVEFSHECQLQKRYEMNDIQHMCEIVGAMYMVVDTLMWTRVYVFVRLCVQCFSIRCSCAVHLTPWRLSLFSIRHLYEHITEISTLNVYWTGKRHHSSDEKISQNLIVISFPDTNTHIHTHILFYPQIRYVGVSLYRMQFSISGYIRPTRSHAIHSRHTDSL